VFFDHGGGEGGIDGAVCDRDGDRLERALGRGIASMDIPPMANGSSLAQVCRPARSSCPAFVGVETDRLLVTSARNRASRTEALAADPEAGIDFPARSSGQRPFRARLHPLTDMSGDLPK
jgi:sugar lactone lactonase YvrE